jgi:plasmid stability protein
MVNFNKLKGRIVESGFSVEDLAKKIGITASTFYRKLTPNSKSFTVIEAADIGKELKLNTEDLCNIFFA